MGKQEKADFHFGTVKSVRLHPNPEGHSRQAFTLRIKAQRGSFAGDRWFPVPPVSGLSYTSYSSISQHLIGCEAPSC